MITDDINLKPTQQDNCQWSRAAGHFAVGVSFLISRQRGRDLRLELLVTRTHTLSRQRLVTSHT
eukprot:2270322-Rhodomonas_salina.2